LTDVEKFHPLLSAAMAKSVSIGVHPWLNLPVDDEPIQLPIDGVLDLHTFQPREVKSLVLDYLAECQARGILRVRIIHGKGIGRLGRNDFAPPTAASQTLTLITQI
jgi:hypothetical protein